jgi:hypothetical protein
MHKFTSITELDSVDRMFLNVIVRINQESTDHRMLHPFIEYEMEPVCRQEQQNLMPIGANLRIAGILSIETKRIKISTVMPAGIQAIND